MIRKYRFGSPIETDSVVNKQDAEKGSVPYLNVKEEDGKLIFTFEMSAEDAVYGLGENVRGINKRGWIYESRCLDDPNHRESSRSLYAAHNFLIVSGEKTFGVFFDYAGIITYDIGYTKLNEMTITAAEADLDLYIIEAEKEDEKNAETAIVRSLRRLTGRSYIPPKWAFGYQQCRWSYMNEDEVREVVRNHRENNIPLDTVYLDIDYMERYKDFTVSDEAFPNFREFVEEMKAQNIRLIPIIDAGVKIEEGYATYEEGVKNRYFVQNEDGSDFVGGVWPGRVHFPDFLNKETRQWFGRSYKVLLDQGIEGFWNDMNEPALFYSEANLNTLFSETEKYKGRNMEISEYNKFQELITSLPNNTEDYKRMYHNINGVRVRHDKVHNLYGYNMTRAAGEAFEEISPDKRILMFSRSSMIGMHRSSGIWMGDNKSWWSHLRMNLRMLPSLNMVGILYTGADLGGFGDDVTEDLLLRWLEMAVFNPLMRNHSAMGTRYQEVYRFGNRDVFRRMIELRYALVPYLYSEFMKAALGDGMMYRPLAFDYPDDSRAAHVEDQLMCGESLMIAPVMEQNADGRYVYLPEDMLMIRTSGAGDYELKQMEKGHYFVPCALGETFFFLRPGHILVLSDPAQCVEKLDMENLHIIAAEGAAAEYVLYDDDGVSRDCSLEKNLTKIRLAKNGNIRVSGAKKITVDRIN